VSAISREAHPVEAAERRKILSPLRGSIRMRLRRVITLKSHGQVPHID